MLERVLNAPLPIRIDGRSRTVPRLEAMALTASNQVLRGEHKGAQTLRVLSQIAHQLAPRPERPDLEGQQHGVLVVPAQMSVEEWERKALELTRQQEALMARGWEDEEEA